MRKANGYSIGQAGEPKTLLVVDDEVAVRSLEAEIPELFTHVKQHSKSAGATLIV